MKMIIKCALILCLVLLIATACEEMEELTPPSTEADQNTETVPTPEPPSNDTFNELRQVCVDYINEYRATLNLPALKRATPEQEICSDSGAKKDGDSRRAHSSAGSCGLGAQNTCPGWDVGGWSGNATVEDALKSCLDMMWAEGPPPVPVRECMSDMFGCFQKHGHYINMTSAQSSVVSCGFYQMQNGSWWMNQDFGTDRPQSWPW